MNYPGLARAFKARVPSLRVAVVVPRIMKNHLSTMQTKYVQIKDFYLPFGNPNTKPRTNPKTITIVIIPTITAFLTAMAAI